METITSEQPTVPADGAEAPAPVAPRRSPLRAALKTGRPQEWIKNLVVFAGLGFYGKLKHPHEVGRSRGPFAAALRAAKAELDPAGMLNPGVLIDPGLPG